MKIGNINISNLKLGIVQIKKVFSGLDLVWTSFLSIINDFKARVLGDGGQFEGETCLNNTLEDMGIDFFEQASLVVTPNGYKEGTLYSIVENDSTTDLTIVRTTTGTRVNSEGLIEQVPYNLFSQSETFDNSYWTKIGSYTLTPNATIAPDGTLTADLFTKTGAINTVVSIVRGSLYTTTGVYTLSFYCKANVGNIVLFRIDTNNTCNALFNFTTKTFTTSGANVISTSYEELSDGWFRLILVGNVIATNWSADIANLFSNPASDSVYVWGAQLVAGSQPKPYLKTISRLNIPRLNYINSTCPAILVEQQRTNVCLQSENFSTTWTGGAGVIVNSTISPDGLQTADTLIDNGTGGYGTKAQTFTITPNSPYVASFFIKKTTGSLTSYPGIGLVFTGVSVRATYMAINTTTGEVTYITASSAQVPSFRSLNVVDYGDYWRVSFLVIDNQSNTGLGYTFYAALTTDFVNGTTTATGSTIVWGAQLELGYDATSYITTTTSIVTRNPDFIYKSGVEDYIGQIEGTLYSEFMVTDNKNWNSGLLVLRGSSNNERVAIRFNSNPGRPSGGFLNLLIVAGGINVVNLNTALIPTTNQWYKVCATYNQTEQKIYVNGVLVATRTGSYTQPLELTTLQLAGYNTSGPATNHSNINIKASAVCKIVITDEQAINLTTL